MGNLRSMLRKQGTKSKKKNNVVPKVNKEQSDTIYEIPADVWNNWNYETKFKVREIIEDESLTHAQCAAMIESMVNDSISNGNKKMEETNELFARLAKKS